MGTVEEIPGPGLGDTQRRVLLWLKRRGPSTVPELSRRLHLTPATLREHLEGLAAQALVERIGVRRSGPGRPEVLYRLARAGEARFPRREGQVLRELAQYLMSSGRIAVLTGFLEARVAARMPGAVARLAGLTGRARMAEVARILSADGYMAEIAAHGPGGAPVLKLCHCPIRDLVAVTDAPCRAEIAFVEALLGQPLERTEFLLDGGPSCSYQVGG
jgi:predicted ArsR family transcriptional regulator